MNSNEAANLKKYLLHSTIDCNDLNQFFNWHKKKRHLIRSDALIVKEIAYFLDFFPFLVFLTLLANFLAATAWAAAKRAIGTL